MAELHRRQALKDSDGKLGAKQAFPPRRDAGQPLSQEAAEDQRQHTGPPAIADEEVENRKEMKAAGARSIARRDLSGGP